jgi:hypothetical protein
MLRKTWLFGVVLVLQAVCAIFFVSDILLSALGVPVDPVPWRFRELMELGAALGLLSGLGLAAMLLRASLMRTRAVEQALRVASGAFMELIDERFNGWGLYPGRA